MEQSRAEPYTLRAGDSASWSRTLDDYDAAAGWSLKYRLLWPAGPSVSIDTSASGTTYTATVTPAQSAGYPAGQATLVAYVENSVSGARTTLDTHQVEILPDLAVALSHDGRTQNQIALADAKTALAAYMAKGQIHVAEYDIAGRTMKFRAASEITDLIAYYEREVFREKSAMALLNGVSAGRVQVRM